MLRELIKGYTLTKDGTKLEKIDEEKFNSFVNTLVSSRENNYICRGTDKSDKILNSTNIKDFNEKFFILGEKSNQFLRPVSDEDIVRYNEESNNDFEIIFDKLNNLFSNDIGDETLRKAIKKFIKAEKSFVTYFKNTSNKQSFINNCNKLSKKNKVNVKDYYFAFLHTFGRDGYHSKSYFLSTSENKNVAEDFRSGGKIIIGWIPRKSLTNQLVKCKLPVDVAKKFKDNEIPIYSTSLFPEEEEISLKCGLLPHYIIGYIKGTNFEINPHILNITKYDNIIDQGIPIDQKNFKTSLERTNYRTFYMLIDGNIYL